jgi:hypothetical protein
MFAWAAAAPPPPEKTDLESCHLYNIHNHIGIGISMAAEKTQIVIVSKSGTLSECIVETKKEATLEELMNILSKKCGNKKSDGFSCYHTYKYKNKHTRKGEGASTSTNVASAAIAPSVLYIDVWCKTDGRAGQENKYELPPPIDEIIIFGNIALVARIDKQTACDLSIECWTKIYEKLFGGFEDLAATAQEDENEIDELAFVPASKKTANGYLKDGFVVDDSIGSGSAGSSDVELAVADAGGAAAVPKKKRNTGGKNKNKTKTQKSDSTTTESEFVTETETETDSISDSEIRSDSSSGGTVATDIVPDPAPAVPAPSNRKVKPSIKKAPVAKKQPTKKDEMKAAAAAAAAAAAVAAILDDGNDSELSEDSYSS